MIAFLTATPVVLMHLLCGTLAVSLIVGGMLGDPSIDSDFTMYGGAAVYLFSLLFCWFSFRGTDAMSQPLLVRRDFHDSNAVSGRHAIRKLVAIGMVFLSICLMYWGVTGWLINSMPAHYLGIALFAFSLAGLCGVNIWVAGPLDPALDQAGERE